MATPILFLHKVSAGAGPANATYFFQTSNVYAGVEDILAITKSTDAADTEQPRVAVKELLRAGVIVRLDIEYKSGTTGPAKFAGILCAKSKLIDVLGGSLNGKTYKVNGTDKGTIKEVIFRRRATFYI